MAVVIEGVDYSLARPSPSGLYRVGKRFVCRYYAKLPNKKCLTQVEAKALMDAGLAIVGNYEQAQGTALGGFSAGVAAAKLAHQQQHDCATPVGAWDHRPIYFSVDFDATNAQMPTVSAFFDGVASVIGRERTGAYGGYRAISWLFDHGKIMWGWQTYAWSSGRWDKRAHIQQYHNDVVVAGGACDLDRAMTADYGQWGYTPQEVRPEMDANAKDMVPELTNAQVGSDVWHIVAGQFVGNNDPKTGDGSRFRIPNRFIEINNHIDKAQAALVAKMDTMVSATGGLTDADRALIQSLVDSNNALKASVDALNHRLTTE